jgi:hypothetical protein
MKVPTRITVEERREVPNRRTERSGRPPPARRLNPLGEVGRTLTAGLAASASVSMLPAGTGVGVYLAVPWNAWALTYLALTWVLMLRSSPRQTRQWARPTQSKGGDGFRAWRWRFSWSGARVACFS